MITKSTRKSVVQELVQSDPASFRWISFNISNQNSLLPNSPTPQADKPSTATASLFSSTWELGKVLQFDEKNGKYSVSLMGSDIEEQYGEDWNGY